MLLGISSSSGSIHIATTLTRRAGVRRRLVCSGVGLCGRFCRCLPTFKRNVLTTCPGEKAVTLHSSFLKMEAACSFEAQVPTYCSACYHIPEQSSLLSYHFVNLRSWGFSFRSSAWNFLKLLKWFLGTCAILRKGTISFVLSVRPSLRPYGTTRLPLDGLSLNFIFEYFSKIFREKFKFH